MYPIRDGQSPCKMNCGIIAPYDGVLIVTEILRKSQIVAVILGRSQHVWHVQHGRALHELSGIRLRYSRHIYLHGEYLNPKVWRFVLNQFILTAAMAKQWQCYRPESLASKEA